MKKTWTMGAAVLMALSMTGQAFAGGWMQDASKPANENGISNWWYQRDDGSYPVACWEWIDGNRDGIAESYRFNESGWMYVSTNVDGYDVNDSGAWTTNGVVETKNTSSQADVPENTVGSWVTDSGRKQYIYSNGEYATGWKKISGKQYYFDESGCALTGYEEIDGQYYYFNGNGELVKKTYHNKGEGVYYVIDKADYYVIDIVDDEDWEEYRKEMEDGSSSSSSSSSSQNDEENIAQADELTDEEAYKKIIALKSKYPEGKRWDNDNSYKSGNRTGYGCAGFAFMVQDAVFGKSAKKTKYDTFDGDALRVGDHLRVYNSTGGEHSIIVLGIDGDTVTICEGNYNRSIHWGRTFTMDKLEDDFIYRETCYSE